MPYHFQTICQNIRCRSDFVAFNFMMRLKGKKTIWFRPGRYAFMDNLPMVWIGFYWFPLFWRYLGLKCNIGHTQRNSPIVYAARITAFLFLCSRSFFGSFICSLRAVPLTASTNAYVIPWKGNFFMAFSITDWNDKILRRAKRTIKRWTKTISKRKRCSRTR